MFLVAVIITAQYAKLITCFFNGNVYRIAHKVILLIKIILVKLVFQLVLLVMVIKVIVQNVLIIYKIRLYAIALYFMNLRELIVCNQQPLINNFYNYLQ